MSEPPPLDPALETPEIDEEKILEGEIEEITKEMERLRAAPAPDAARLAELQERLDGLHVLLRFIRS